jgi:hypothetical protein
MSDAGATARMPSFPGRVTCPCCAGALALVRDRNLGEGETGGMASVREYRCAVCALVVVQTRVDKLGDARETWRFADAPPMGGPTVPKRSGASRCADCGGANRAAMPPEHAPAPPIRLGSHPDVAQLHLSVQIACDRCGSTSYVHERP